MQQWKTDTSRSSTNLPEIQITKFAHPNGSSEGLPFFKCKAPLFIQPPWSSAFWISLFSLLQVGKFQSASRRTSRCPRLMGRRRYSITHFDQESFFQNIPRKALQYIIFNMLVGLLQLATWRYRYLLYILYVYIYSLHLRSCPRYQFHANIKNNSPSAHLGTPTKKHHLLFWKTLYTYLFQH